MKEKKMSSSAYERPMHAVPDIPLTPTQYKFTTLLVLRATARQALDKAMAVPRSAIRWVLSQLHRWVEAAGGLGVLSWASDHARDAVGLIRAAGVVPSVLAVLSMPPVTAAAARVGKFVGRGIVTVAKATWTGIKSLLGRWGTTGAQIVQTLSTTSTKILDAVKAVAQHPVVKPVVHVLKATLALVRPISRGFVAHQLLGALVPVLWLRAMIGFLFMPLLVDTNLAGNVWDWTTTQPMDPTTPHNTQGTDRAEGNLLTFGATATPTETVPSDIAQADVAEQGGDPEVEDDEEPFLNRAERRAQQREDRRNHPRR